MAPSFHSLLPCHHHINISNIISDSFTARPIKSIALIIHIKGLHVVDNLTFLSSFN